jgi:hypothetical protein
MALISTKTKKIIIRIYIKDVKVRADFLNAIEEKGMWMEES